MFNEGDKIFYPMHGAGVIDRIEEKTILGKDEKYYIIKMPGEVTIMVPQDHAEELGLRHLVSKEQAKEVLGILLEDTTDMSEKWSKRYNDNKERLKTGDLFEIADIYRNLSFRNKEKNLSTSEKKMFLNAQQVLISELSEVTGENYDTLQNKIDEKINQNYIDSIPESNENA